MLAKHILKVCHLELNQIRKKNPGLAIDAYRVSEMVPNHFAIHQGKDFK